MQRHSFVTVLLMASIPNPLFDLAGLTCGHLLIPFATFFTATTIGKAGIKVHLQLLLIIFGFSDRTIDLILRKIARYVSKSWAGKLRAIMEKQKQVLIGGQDAPEEFNLFGFLWNGFLGLMVLYFLVSVVDSVAQSQFEWELKREQQRKAKSKKL